MSIPIEIIDRIKTVPGVSGVGISWRNDRRRFVILVDEEADIERVRPLVPETLNGFPPIFELNHATSL